MNAFVGSDGAVSWSALTGYRVACSKKRSTSEISEVRR